MDFKPKSTKALGKTGVKILCYGRPNVGKTTQILTLRKPLIVTTERGLLTIRAYDLPFLTMETLPDVYEFIDWLKIPSNYSQYNCIVLESITDISYRILDTMKTTTKDGRKAYGETQDAIIALLRAITDNVHINFYITAWEYDHAVQDAPKIVQTRPELTGNVLPIFMPHLLDVIVQLGIHYRTVVDEKTKQQVQQAERFFQCNETANVLARDRTGTLAMFEPANLQALFDKIASKP